MLCYMFSWEQFCWLALPINQNFNIWDIFSSYSNKSSMQKLGVCFIVHNFEISIKIWTTQQHSHFAIYVCYLQFVEWCNCNSICCSWNYQVYFCHYCQQKSSDTIWFVKIIKKGKVAENVFNKYGHFILNGDSILRQYIWNLN